MCNNENNGNNEQGQYKAEDFIDINTWLPNFKGYSELPFREQIDDILVNPRPESIENSIHVPNTIRFIYEILDKTFEDDNPNFEPKVRKVLRKLMFFVEEIFNLESVKAPPKDTNNWSNKIREIEDKAEKLDEQNNENPENNINRIEDAKKLIKVASLYHDIGKSISRSNHPQIGVNILRNIQGEERSKLIIKIGADNYSLLCSMIQHHDKFGNLCTGEASLTILSDVLYFTSSQKRIAGALRNVTSVMLLNLADMAAVCNNKTKSKRATELVREIKKLTLENLELEKEKKSQGIQQPRLTEIENLIPNNNRKLDLYKTEYSSILYDKEMYFGLTEELVTDYYDNYRTIIYRICESKADRQELKKSLIKFDQKPVGLIQRITRLLRTATKSVGGKELRSYFSEASVESVLLGLLGSRFEDFCNRFALVVKMSYAKRFFEKIALTEIRMGLGKKTEVDPSFVVSGLKNWTHFLFKLKNATPGSIEEMIYKELSLNCRNQIDLWNPGKAVKIEIKMAVIDVLNRMMEDLRLYEKIGGRETLSNNCLSKDLKKYLKDKLRKVSSLLISPDDFQYFIRNTNNWLRKNKGKLPEWFILMTEDEKCEEIFKQDDLRKSVNKLKQIIDGIDEGIPDIQKDLLGELISEFDEKETRLLNRLMIESLFENIFEASQLYDVNIFENLEYKAITDDDIKRWDMLEINLKNMLGVREIVGWLKTVLDGKLIEKCRKNILRANSKVTEEKRREIILEVLDQMLKSDSFCGKILETNHHFQNESDDIREKIDIYKREHEIAELVKVPRYKLWGLNRFVLQKIFPNSIEVVDDSSEKPELLQLEELSKKQKQKLADKITEKFTSVIYRLIQKYSVILNPDSGDYPRIGFQMETLTGNPDVTRKIIYLLCSEEDYYIALSWITDEVSIWSFD